MLPQIMMSCNMEVQLSWTCHDITCYPWPCKEDKTDNFEILTLLYVICLGDQYPKACIVIITN